jgi:hypothetical protein
MPIENNFQHDELSRKHPGERLAAAEFTAGPPPDSPEWTAEMIRLGSTMGRAGVRTVMFVHGAIHGTDVFGTQRLDDAGGLKRGYSMRSSPPCAKKRMGSRSYPPGSDRRSQTTKQRSSS